VTKHHREKTPSSYACQCCGHHEHPLVGTIFENFATPLRLWFHAMYLMSSTRCGIPAKQSERELSVTYKTARLKFHKIRTLLEQDGNPFGGTVEMDEAYVGGKAKWSNRGVPEGKGRGTVGKTPVFGMAQRANGDEPGKIAVKVVEGNGAKSLLPRVRTKVLPESAVYTVEYRPYDKLGKMGYKHYRVHHKEKVYVSGDVHTNTIEGFWSHMKRGLSAVYRGVSSKHLQCYLDEFVFRYNNRMDERGCFHEASRGEALRGGAAAPPLACAPPRAAHGRGSDLYGGEHGERRGA